MSRGLGRRHGLDPALPWLWCRPAATAPIRPLAWGPPYAADVALKSKKKKKKKKKITKEVSAGFQEAQRISTLRNMIIIDIMEKTAFSLVEGGV